jgi:hypothetical protein
LQASRLAAQDADLPKIVIGICGALSDHLTAPLLAVCNDHSAGIAALAAPPLFPNNSPLPLSNPQTPSCSIMYNNKIKKKSKKKKTAMEKKARSKQMAAIIDRLLRFGEFEVVLFGDDAILNKPVDQWPICQCLLSWHSEGFPLDKAQEYVTLRKPYLVNDVNSQDVLLDRRKVYQRLIESGVMVPLHIVVSREDLPEGQTDPGKFYVLFIFQSVFLMHSCDPAPLEGGGDIRFLAAIKNTLAFSSSFPSKLTTTKIHPPPPQKKKN